MNEISPMLKKLREQEAALKIKIREAQKIEAKKASEIKSREYAAIGYAVLSEMNENNEVKETIIPLLEKWTTSAKDRKLLGLMPLPKSEPIKKEEKQE